MENWNGISDKELDNLTESKTENEFIDSMINLQKLNQGIRNYAEVCRIKAGNAIMNYITDYFLDQAEFYKERYGSNFIEAMRDDKVWIFESDDKFNELMEEYFENTVG